MTINDRRSQRAMLAHGILCACASPQFREMMEERARSRKITLSKAIASFALAISANLDKPFAKD